MFQIPGGPDISFYYPIVNGHNAEISGNIEVRFPDDSILSEEDWSLLYEPHPSDEEEYLKNHKLRLDRYDLYEYIPIEWDEIEIRISQLWDSLHNSDLRSNKNKQMLIQERKAIMREFSDPEKRAQALFGSTDTPFQSIFSLQREDHEILTL